MILENIHSPQDIKKLNIEQLTQLADEIRTFLIQNVAQTGGHLASNLGIVELTLAIHYVYDLPDDKIIWDVGHQAYVHKILTGRKDAFTTLRQSDGIAGFPKTSESVYDAFNTGHSSTSISAAAGFAKAQQLLKKKPYHVAAVIGDGSMTGGMAFEALNYCGHEDIPMLVILNDNEMSISENVGGLAANLSKLRTASAYIRLKTKVSNRLVNTHDGKKLHRMIRNIKNTVKYMLLHAAPFEMFGFNYIGPVDGHDLRGLIQILKRLKYVDDQIVLHVRTIKGKGYIPAQQNPGKFHGVPKFNPEDGTFCKTSSQTYSQVFGNQMIRLAKKDSTVIAVTAAMPAGTGLLKFQTLYPQRLIDVGIAEQHAVTLAAGLCMGGLKPVVAIYSTFLQRAYDQVLHDVALQNLHVVFCLDRAGIVGEDGETHQGIYDIAYLSHIPNMAIAAPSCFSEMETMLEYALFQHNGPIAIRYPRGGEAHPILHNTKGMNAEVLKQGTEVIIMALGAMVEEALLASEQLEKQHISCTVLDIRFAKPLDFPAILAQSKRHRLIVTMEDGVKIGGIGEQIGAFLEENQFTGWFLPLAYSDCPIQQGKRTTLIQQNGMDGSSVAKQIGDIVKQWKNNV